MLHKLSTAAAIAIWLPVTAFLFYALLIRRDLLPLAFAVAVLFALVWIVLQLVASLTYRICTGKFIFPPRFPNALFRECWVSGRGHKNLLFQRPAASNCLWVAVLPGRLRVGAVFPFNLFFMPERLGLEYDIPREHIVSVKRREARFGGASIVSVRFRSDGDNELEFDVSVRDEQLFIAAVEEISEISSTADQSAVGQN